MRRGNYSRVSSEGLLCQEKSEATQDKEDGDHRIDGTSVIAEVFFA